MSDAPEQARPEDALALIDDFPAFARRCWTVRTKSHGFQPFVLTPAQRLIWTEFKRQWNTRGYVRMNILKCRQVGGSTFVRMMELWFVLTRPGVSSLSLAHDEKLPTSWLLEAKRNYEEMPPALFKRGLRTSGNSNIMRFDHGSAYGIGSAQGGFPGMGDTIQFLHVSEIGRWDKPPISLDPDQVLIPLDPAIPKGRDKFGTVQMWESTGVAVGDYWCKAWDDGKREGSDFVNVFLPWFLVEEYRDDAHAAELGDLTEYEKWLEKEAAKYGVTLDAAQIVWRRKAIAERPFFGNVDLWAAEFPACESEAFMSPGQQVFTREQIEAARKTVREPIWRGDLIVADNPLTFNVIHVDKGPLAVLQEPDERYHYVIGADCRWSEKHAGTDYNQAYVQCLETMRKVAWIRGQHDLTLWGKLLCALGYWYNTAVLAPERNSKAASELMPLLLGNVAPWSYPNIWVRTDDVALKGNRPQDYGWQTNGNSKGEIINFAKHATLNGEYDWADEMAVDEAQRWFYDEEHAGNPTAPTGQHDDALMSNMITSYVAHKVRPNVTLYVEPIKHVFTLRSLSQRVTEELELVDEV